MRNGTKPGEGRVNLLLLLLLLRHRDARPLLVCGSRGILEQGHVKIVWVTKMEGVVCGRADNSSSITSPCSDLLWDCMFQVLWRGR